MAGDFESAAVMGGASFLNKMAEMEQRRREAEISNEMKKRERLQSLYQQGGQLEAEALKSAIQSLGQALLR